MTETQQCKVCGESNPCVLEQHHKIPRRHNGPDTKENLVTLCANCHRTIENIFDEQFWKVVGLSKYEDPDAMAQFNLMSELDDLLTDEIREKEGYLNDSTNIEDLKSADYSNVPNTQAYELGIYKGLNKAKHTINTYDWTA